MFPKVTDVERIFLRVPFRERVKLWNSLLVHNWQIVEVIRVLTEDPEVIGYGETLIYYTHETVSDESIQRVIGKPVIDHVSEDLLGAGLQMALYDAAGKAVGQPMYKLLGKPQVRDWVPVSWWNTKAPPEVLAAEAQDALKEGFLSHKIKARPWFDVHEQVAAIAAVTPKDYAIDIDWNALLMSTPRAIETVKRLEAEPRVGLFEDPIPREDLIGQASLRSRLNKPMVTHFYEALFPSQTKLGSVDGYVVDGGVHRALRNGTTLAALNLSFFMQYCGTGLTAAMSSHVASVLTHAHWPAVTAMNTFSETLLAQPLQIEGGYMRVPTEPGLGVTVDESALERLRIPTNDRLEMPRVIMEFKFSETRSRLYANSRQLWQDFDPKGNGALPVQPEGGRLFVTEDDGSPEFKELHEKASQNPIWTAQSIR